MIFASARLISSRSFVKIVKSDLSCIRFAWIFRISSAMAEMLSGVPNTCIVASIIACSNFSFGMLLVIIQMNQVDNVSKFADFNGMQPLGKQVAEKIYYCHPYCLCERGTNERINRELRRVFPKVQRFESCNTRRSEMSRRLIE